MPAAAGPVRGTPAWASSGGAEAKGGRAAAAGVAGAAGTLNVAAHSVKGEGCSAGLGAANCCGGSCGALPLLPVRVKGSEPRVAAVEGAASGPPPPLAGPAGGMPEVEAKGEGGRGERWLERHAGGSPGGCAAAAAAGVEAEERLVSCVAAVWRLLGWPC